MSAARPHFLIEIIRWALWTISSCMAKAGGACTSVRWRSQDSNDWLVKDKDIAPHIPVIDKSKREDGTFSRGVHSQLARLALFVASTGWPISSA
jgi:hypothetical protein